MEKRLWHLVVGTRGGLKRARILQLLELRPYNAREISLSLGVDYKTARHHLQVLLDNGLVERSEDRYGTLYFWSDAMRREWVTFERILASLDAPDGRAPDARGEPAG